MLAIAALLAAAIGTADGPPPPSLATYKPRRARPSDRVRIDGELYGPRREFRGVSAGAFELSSFGGCWFTNSPEYYRQFQALALPKPPPRQEVVHYELAFIGRQTVAKPGQRGGYGHLGMWHCQIRAETLISAKLLAPGWPTIPPPPS
jgi:hypothetical protein